MFDYIGIWLSALSFLALPVIFIIFLILAVIHIRKAKKKEEGKGKAIAYSIVSGVALIYIISAIIMVIWLAQGISHM